MLTQRVIRINFIWRFSSESMYLLFAQVRSRQLDGQRTRGQICSHQRRRYMGRNRLQSRCEARWFVSESEIAKKACAWQRYSESYLFKFEKRACPSTYILYFLYFLHFCSLRGFRKFFFSELIWLKLWSNLLIYPGKMLQVFNRDTKLFTRWTSHLTVVKRNDDVWYHQDFGIVKWL